MLIRHGMTEARHLLRLLASFADAPIPYELLFRPGLMANSLLFTGLTGTRLWECLQALEAFGFIDLLPAEDGELAVSVLRLHPLVRDTSQSASGIDGHGDAYIDLSGSSPRRLSPRERAGKSGYVVTVGGTDPAHCLPPWRDHRSSGCC